MDLGFTGINMATYFVANEVAMPSPFVWKSRSKGRRAAQAEAGLIGVTPITQKKSHQLSYGKGDARPQYCLKLTGGFVAVSSSSGNQASAAFRSSVL